MIEARSDVVGSLLRTPRLLEAREAFATGSLSTAELKAAEDEAVDDLQGLGVDVVVLAGGPGDVPAVEY